MFNIRGTKYLEIRGLSAESNGKTGRAAVLGENRACCSMTHSDSFGSPRKSADNSGSLEESG